jgi:hypothetical protein
MALELPSTVRNFLVNTYDTYNINIQWRRYTKKIEVGGVHLLKRSRDFENL